MFTSALSKIHLDEFEKSTIRPISDRYLNFQDGPADANDSSRQFGKPISNFVGSFKPFIVPTMQDLHNERISYVHNINAANFYKTDNSHVNHLNEKLSLENIDLSFTTLNSPAECSRVLHFGNISINFDLNVFQNICAQYGDIAIMKCEAATLNSLSVIVGWFDLRNAIEAFQHISADIFSKASVFITDIHYMFDEANAMLLQNSELQYLRQDSAVIYISWEIIEGEATTRADLLDRLTAFGDVLTLELVEIYKGHRIFKCAFFDIRALKTTEQLFDNNTLNGAKVSAKHEISLIHANINLEQQRSLRQKHYRSADELNGFDTRSRVLRASKPYNTLKTFSKTSRGYEDAFNQVRDQLDMLENNFVSLRGLRSLRVTVASVPIKSAIDLVRIAKGYDTRTTIMIRNIPNKIGQAALKSFIDASNENTYDFLYLRIDFANSRNVGYAFVSFTAPEHIITFAKARVGKKWNRFNSIKYCDISYANVQGQESLIEKFRNSDVMNQAPEFRPKLYYTEGPLIGEEKPFPDPSNGRSFTHTLASIRDRNL